MRTVIDTSAEGTTLTAEQLADAGVAPGERAVIEIHRYDVEDWIAETEGRVLSTDEFVEHLSRAPGSDGE